MSELNVESLQSERIQLAGQVDALRNEIAIADDATRLEKAADFESLVNKLENCDKQFRLAQKLDESERLIKNLSNQPARPVPTQSAVISRNSGHVYDGGELASLSDQEALTSRDYNKAFEAFIASKGRLERVKSRNHRDMLENYGKGGERNLPENEIFLPNVGFYNKTATLGSTANGSTWVAPDFRFDPITQRTVAPVAMQICNVITTNVSTVTFPRNISDGNADSGRLGVGFGANYTSGPLPIKGEQPSGTLYDTGPFDTLTINAKTGTLSTDVSADMWMDVPGFSGYLQNQVQRLFAARVDAAVFSPTQISGDAESIIGNANVGYIASGTSAALGNATVTGTDSIYDNLAQLFYYFRASYGSNIAWVYNRATHGKLARIKDTTGNPILTQFTPGTFGNSINQALFGSPVYFAEYMQASGSANARSILVGDFNEYYLLMRQGFTVVIDDLSQQYKNNIRVNFKYRFGGAVRDYRAFVSLKEAVS